MINNLFFLLAAVCFLASVIVGYVRHNMLDLQDAGAFFLVVALYLVLTR